MKHTKDLVKTKRLKVGFLGKSSFIADFLNKDDCRRLTNITPIFINKYSEIINNDIVVLQLSSMVGEKIPENAIKELKKSEIPFVVAITDVEYAFSQPERVKRELSEFDIVSDEWGGDVRMDEIEGPIILDFLLATLIESITLAYKDFHEND